MANIVDDVYENVIKKGSTVKVRFYDEADLLHCVTGTFVGASEDTLFIKGHDGFSVEYEIHGWMIEKERVDVCHVF